METTIYASTNLKWRYWMLRKAGFIISLFPLALIDSVIAVLMAVVLFAISLTVNKRITVFDFTLVVLVCAAGLSWMAADVVGKQVVGTQLASYVVFVCSLRFFHSSRQQLLEFVLGVRLSGWILLCMLYIIIQVKVGYIYEVGVLEVLLLVRIASSTRQRMILLAILVSYLIAMFLISTRSTPLLVALIVLIVSFVRVPTWVWKSAYVLPLLITPVIGVLAIWFGFSSDQLDFEDNAEIRLEMIKGATSQIGAKEFLLGNGFGTPYRDPVYNYSFSHTLLNDPLAVYQVSNHNSLFDIFLRFGFFGYVFFCIVFLKALRLNKASSHYTYMLLFLAIYSLSVNAYMDATRLAHSCASIIGGIYILLHLKSISQVNVVDDNFTGPNNLNKIAT